MIRWLAPAVFAFAIGGTAAFFWGIFWSTAAEAIDVDMKPAACYTHIGERSVDEKHGFAAWALVFDGCRRDYKWVKVPLPPSGEA
jgi:hypothetical protein